jgi:uncharacterized protein (DUF1800 family)
MTFQSRSFRCALVVWSLFIAAGCAPLRNSASPYDEPRELTADQQVKQVFNRLTFGPEPGELASVNAKDLDNWLVQQLEPQQIVDSRADSILSQFVAEQRTVRELADSFPSQDVFIRELRKERSLRPADPFTMSTDDSARLKGLNDRGNRLAQQIGAAKVARAVFSKRQVLEVMTDFWENHFSVYSGKMPTRFSLIEYDRDVIRPHALGKFRDLLGAVARSPEMLYYLDNWQSQADSMHMNLDELHALMLAKTSGDSSRVIAGMRRRRQGINENYGRELLELHTLGVDGGYSQRDVIDVARAFTGWTINDPRAGGSFVFRPSMHDAGEKHVLGHTLAAGRGQEDGEEVLDILARQPATARFIATKLVRHFVSDAPPKPLVDRVAAVFLHSDGDIRQLIMTIATSSEFYSMANYRRKVKEPFELVVSTLRALDADPDTTGRSAQLSASLGQPIFGRLTPDGWPDNAEAWINTGSMLNRINFGATATTGRIPGVFLRRWKPAATLLPMPFEQQVDGVVESVLEGEASPETRQVLIEGTNPIAPMSKPADPQARQATPIANLAILVGLALGAPEFQHR